MAGQQQREDGNNRWSAFLVGISFSSVAFTEEGGDAVYNYNLVLPFSSFLRLVVRVAR
jgi:hypothetical protein